MVHYFLALNTTSQISRIIKAKVVKGAQIWKHFIIFSFFFAIITFFIYRSFPEQDHFLNKWILIVLYIYFHFYLFSFLLNFKCYFFVFTIIFILHLKYYHLLAYFRLALAYPPKCKSQLFPILNVAQSVELIKLKKMHEILF